MQKKILILGGTMFTGRALVEKLLSDNRYAITLFNRGKSNSGIFPNVTQFHGNRETDDILQVCDKHWDVVVDFSGYYPKTFAQLLDRWRGNVGRYIFVSTISVYQFDEGHVQNIGEDDATLSCSEVQMISALPDAYGEKKAEMERILLSHPEFDPVIFRPSFIYGRYDWTDRFYYWLYKAKTQSRMLLPKSGLLTLTYVDDLVKGIVQAIEGKGQQQVYNAVTHNDIHLADIVRLASQCFQNSSTCIPFDAALQTQFDVQENEFPLSLPFDLNVSGKSWQHDFAITPQSFTETIKESIAYYETLKWPIPKVGLSNERELDILEQMANGGPSIQ